MKIAITGGIAEGKSTVLEVLRSEGLRVLSADEIVRQLWSERSTLDSLSQLLSLENPTKGDVTRAIVESNTARQVVNHLFHPLVHQRIMESDADAIEIPLLIETCMQSTVDQIWVVTCGSEEQLRRLSSRVGEAQAQKMIRLQLPTRAKIPFADEVLRTNRPLRDVHTAIRQALARLRQTRSEI
ncbi:MAG: dephospho-CoA kinase [Fimbriimonadaceae bacterium]|nr:dephospho-CoA kinase [Fimbriimonadaceae bacterium]